MKESEEEQEAWKFEFSLYHDSEDGMLKRSKAHEFFMAITAWAEDNECLVAGGYRAFTEAEKNDDSVYELKPE